MAGPPPQTFRLARFGAPGRLRVADTSIEAARVIIATGATPAVPAGWRERLGDRLVVGDDVFEWDALPESVAVVGTGVVGLELARRCTGSGCGWLFGRSQRVGPLTDPALQAAVAGWINATLPYSGNVGEPRVEPRRGWRGRHLEG